ncbi:MAG: polysaccharide export protein [Hyphomonas sp.]|jgi:polysaccharide export outer membrane protein|nr:polysaccharide export protein [Hyphomonas sp.]
MTSRFGVLAAVGVVAIISTGCGSMPASGPAGAVIASSAASAVPAAPPEERRPFVLVDLAQRVSARLPDSDPGTLQGTFGSRARSAGASNILVGVGDTIQVTIFESARGGLFIPEDASSRSGNFVTLPPQVVDRSGTIRIPYAGQITVAGRSIRQIQDAIETPLRSRAIEPQVVVTILNQRATEVSVLGEVGSANKFAVNPNGDRLLDMISRAGGIRAPGFETYVTVQRGGKSASVYFQRLVRDPSENIFMRPGDTVLVTRDPRFFTVFGAAGQNGRFTFDRERISLAEAIGRAGGLVDARANPSQVFLYRNEPRSMLARLGADLSAFPHGQQHIPTIYQADLRDPGSFFVTQQFSISNNDVIYVGNADSVELVKVFNTISSVVQPFAQGSSVGLNVRRIGE